MNKPKNTDFIGIIFIAYIFLIANLEVCAQSFDCPCPVGGEYKIGEELPDTLNGKFSQKDFKIEIDKSCWDFGSLDQIPDDGRHPFDKFEFIVTDAGQFSFTGSDNNKLIIGVYKVNFTGTPICDSLILGVGAYVVDSAVLYFEEPQNDGKVNNVVYLDTGVVYGVVVVDYDTDFRGDYHFSIKPLEQGKVLFSKAVYSEECEFYSCYQDTANLDIPIPDVPTGYTIVWNDELMNTSICGEQRLIRDYTVANDDGDTINCTSEYYFTGTDLLSHYKWPKNWDGLQGHNPILFCNDLSDLDANGNPDQDITGKPSGFTYACNTIEVYYQDNLYQLEDRTKILRNWTIIDNCTGIVLQHIQVIIVKNEFIFKNIVGDSLRFKTKSMSCFADIDIPKIPLLGEKCSTISAYWTTIDDVNTIGDVNENGFYDSTEVWVLKDVPVGQYNLCYHMVDSTEYQTEKCINFTVYDGNPPVPGCKTIKIDYPYCGLTKISATSFNGNSFDNCSSLFFKVVRGNNGFGNDAECNFLKDELRENDAWYSDSVSVCFEDVKHSKVMVSLRVFDVNPGDGAIEPQRFENGGDLYNHYADCWSVINFKDTLKPFIECNDLFLECDESIIPTQNSRLYPRVETGCVFDLEYSDFWVENCGSEIIRTWTISIDNASSQCEQSIFLQEENTSFDPCSIVFPKDIKVNCALDTETFPIWESTSCNDIRAVIIKDDTFKYTEDGFYKIIRDWAVVDNCVYQSGVGAEDNIDMLAGNILKCDSLVNDGYYRYKQTILVYDVLPEIIDCPDVEIACYESLSPEDNKKLELRLNDICNYNSVRYTDKHFDQQCGELIKRTWTISNGVDTSYCLQKIKIIPDKAFNPCSIVFPKKEISILFNDLDNLEMPVWANSHCNNIEAKIVNEDTIIVEQGHRFELIREWAVIDKCKYTPNIGAESNIDSISQNRIDCSFLVNDGYYKFIQTIRVTSPTSIDVVARDTCFGIKDCLAYDLKLSAELIDSCGIANSAEWKYIITNLSTFIVVQYSYNVLPHPNQGVVGDIEKDILNSTDVAVAQVLNALNVGNYKITWTVKGHCGKVKTINQYFSITDRKAPTPIVPTVSEIELVDGKLEITAIDFDGGDCEGCIASYDNCTPKDRLSFSFTDQIPNIWEDFSVWETQFEKYGKYFFNPTDGSISTKENYLEGKADAWLLSRSSSQRLVIKSADDINAKNAPSRIYVWDNFAYNDDCDDNNFEFSNIVIHLKSETVNNISGHITLVDSKTPFDGMNMVAKNENVVSKTVSDMGDFVFHLKNGNYNLAGSTDDNYLAGISVRDLLLIKLHLLGLKIANSPYKVIAMDSNKDGNITASDINSISKVLLRKSLDFDNNSWLAISKDYEFDNSSNAIEEVENAKIRNIKIEEKDVQNMDFYAVKIGDIDFSTFNSLPKDSEDVNIFIKNKKFNKGEFVNVPVYAKDYNEVIGMQFALNVQGMDFVDIDFGVLKIFSDSYNEVVGNLFIGFNDFEKKTIGDNEVLFTIKFKAKKDSDLKDALKLNSALLSSEAYKTLDLNVAKLTFKVIETNDVNYENYGTECVLFQNIPNPFLETTEILFKTMNTSKYKITIIDVTGKKLKSYFGNANRGINKVKIKNDDLNSKGVLFYRLETTDFIATKKMIAL